MNTPNTGPDSMYNRCPICDQVCHINDWNADRSMCDRCADKLDELAEDPR